MACDGRVLIYALISYLDIQANNILISTKDESIFHEWDENEQAKPSRRKIDGDRIIYQSRPFRRKKGWTGFGLPLLSDFGEARIGDVHSGLIQPDIYRAPEVILGMKWTSKVDIWNVGALVCQRTIFPLRYLPIHALRHDARSSFNIR
jgi:serine/threonine-protein kinase SRPK3